MRKAGFVNFAILIVFLSVCSALCHAKIIHVDINTPNDNDGSDWANAYAGLQPALAGADPCDEIWVAEGTYYPSSDYGLGIGDRGKHFRMINKVAIYGGFNGTETSLAQRDVLSNETILSGDIGTVSDNFDNCYHVFYHPGGLALDPNAILDGFTITAGNGDGSGNHIYGGGMFNFSSSPVVTNCAFIANSAAATGGGMFNYESSSPTVTDCTFTGNSAGRGGGMFNYNFSNPTVTDCTFDNNGTVEYHGGGVYNDNSSPVFTRCNFLNNYTTPYSNPADGAGMYNYNCTKVVLNACIFKGNEATDLRYVPSIVHQGGAIYNNDSHVNMYGCNFEDNFANYSGGAIGNWGSSSVTATNCKFSKNKAGSITFCSGGAICGGDPVLTNCEFVRNSSYHGGAISGSNLDLRNCTLVQNTAALGGAIYNGSDLTASNCILWGNTDAGGTDESAQIHITSGATFINYCCIQGWTGSLGGVGNIDTDPEFVDPNGADGVIGTEDDNLRLSPDSPCIDTGDNIAVTEPNDLDGHTRIVDGDCDGTATVDMGAYEFDWLYLGDLAGGCDVNLEDFAVLAESFGQDNPAIDIAPYPAPDGIIDFRELLILAEHWLEGTE